MLGVNDLFGRITKRTTDYENHRTESEYEDKDELEEEMAEKARNK